MSNVNHDDKQKFNDLPVQCTATFILFYCDQWSVGSQLSVQQAQFYSATQIFLYSSITFRHSSLLYIDDMLKAFHKFTMFTFSA